MVLELFTKLLFSVMRFIFSFNILVYKIGYYFNLNLSGDDLTIYLRIVTI